MLLDGIGPWIFTGIGALGALRAFFGKTTDMKVKLLDYVFSVLLLGVGVFGPGFMTPYGEILGKLDAVMRTDAPTAEAQRELARFVADESIPDEARDVAMRALSSRPTADTRESSRSPPRRRRPTPAAACSCKASRPCARTSAASTTS